MNSRAFRLFQDGHSYEGIAAILGVTPHQAYGKVNRPNDDQTVWSVEVVRVTGDDDEVVFGRESGVGPAGAIPLLFGYVDPQSDLKFRLWSAEAATASIALRLGSPKFGGGSGTYESETELPAGQETEVATWTLLSQDNGDQAPTDIFTDGVSSLTFADFDGMMLVQASLSFDYA